MAASTSHHLQIGSIAYDGIDQIDLTGPFEVLSQIPDSTYRIYGLDAGPVTDVGGLRLLPDLVIEDAPALDVLHIPGGPGQEALMHDGRVLSWIARQAGQARCVFSVCTGALLLGAAGLLVGRRATSHWAVLDLLSIFGAEPVNERVVEDGNIVFAAGVTAGIDGALTVAARLRGVPVAQEIQLHMVYAPEPPFDSGTPDSAPPPIRAAALAATAELTARRAATAREIAGRLGIVGPERARGRDGHAEAR